MIIIIIFTDKINQKVRSKSKIISYQRRDGSLPDLCNELNASFGLILFYPWKGSTITLQMLNDKLSIKCHYILIQAVKNIKR